MKTAKTQVRLKMKFIKNHLLAIPILILSFVSFKVSAQYSSTWKGMTPGHERQWSYPSNWSRNAIPDEFTDVVIPFDITGGQNYPVLKISEGTINSLYIAHGAHITIWRGRLITLDEAKNFYKPFQIIEPDRIIKNRPGIGEELVSVKKNAFLK